MKLAIILQLLGASLEAIAGGSQYPLQPAQDASPAELPHIIYGIRGERGYFGSISRPAKIRIVDVESRTQWEWEATNIDKSIPSQIRSCIEDGVSVTEVKWAKGGTRIVAIVNNAAIIITHAPGDDKDKQVEFAVCITSSHTVELLPDGFLAVATTGKSPKDGIEVYDIDQFELKKQLGSSPCALQIITGFPAVHGLLWDEAEEKLWAVGNDVAPDGSEGSSQSLLRAYPFNTNHSKGWYPIIETGVKSYNISPPQQLDVEWTGSDARWWDGPHDLIGVPDERLMLISTDLDAHVFDAESRAFLEEDKVIERFLQGFRPIGERKGTNGTTLPRSDIKSMSLNGKDYLLYVQAIWGGWFGNRISIIGNGSFQRDIAVPEQLYKSRWFAEVPKWPTAR